MAVYLASPGMAEQAIGAGAAIILGAAITLEQANGAERMKVGAAAQVKGDKAGAANRDAINVDSGIEAYWLIAGTANGEEQTREDMEADEQATKAIMTTAAMHY